jgi:hypothetical protein
MTVPAPDQLAGLTVLITAGLVELLKRLWPAYAASPKVLKIVGAAVTAAVTTLLAHGWPPTTADAWQSLWAVCGAIALWNTVNAVHSDVSGNTTAERQCADQIKAAKTAGGDG